ncbi:hypothetical protein ABZ714_17970 [Streptomyces sp. NPDC006798]|uniref:hypothetical protein n=1 Tax=Streptomyces sp. NPDC006798 TaxID=3155462 RepID=UPI0033D174FD
MRKHLTSTRTVALACATAALLTGTVSASTAADGSGTAADRADRAANPAATATAAPVTPVASVSNTQGTSRKGPAASVKGKGRIHFTLRPKDTIRFEVDAVAVPYGKPLPGLPTGMPTDGEGTLRYSHYNPDTGETGWAVADIDCVSTGGKTATVTAIIRETNVERVGKRVGISFQQGERGAPARLGFSWGVVNVDGGTDADGQVGGTGTCQAPAPFSRVTEGGYRIRHAEIPPIPTTATTARP